MILKKHYGESIGATITRSLWIIFFYSPNFFT